MTDHVRVEIMPRAVPANERTQVWRQEVAGRLAELGQIDDPDAGAVDAPTQVWEALIGGVRVPLVRMEKSLP